MDDAVRILPDDATRAQVAAADPSGSVWLGANAGSGKTRVLTDRVAWLLLNGAAPERILCLTYTRAAAGEMQNRLYRRLSEWAMLDDDALRAQITRLGAARGTVPTETLRHARTLFARAIETPGGLKIQTIHAFCAALLRRFPLEAGVTPAFAEMDEQAAARLHAEILDDMAATPAFQPIVDAMAAHLSDAEAGKLMAQIARTAEALREGVPSIALRAALGLGPEDADAIRADVCDAGALDLIETVHDAARQQDAVQMVALAERLGQAVLADDATRFDLLCTAFLTKKDTPQKSPLSKAVAEAVGPQTVDAVHALAADLAAAKARIAALGALERSLALHNFAPNFLAELEARKARRGWLDFDDQITKARDLLTRRDAAQWVLFRLDGGLDHILVDEAQDTAPRQWEVIETLAAEFGAGAGARPDVARTLFVVGDRKQSIYSFQGADAAAFERMRSVFASRLSVGAAPLRDHALRHSFRSAPAILRLVDEVFAEPGGLGEASSHIAFHADKPGRVDLWAPEEKPETDDGSRRWFDPVDLPAANAPEVVLAERVADAVARMLSDGTTIEASGVRRPIGAGDVLILLRRRGDLFHAIIAACKRRGLDVAGADRLKLAEDLAVRDLIAALTWAAAPDDDLSLAIVLRSPLGGLDEAELFDLAHDRGKTTLWSRLRDSDHAPQVEMLADLLRVSDILRPYELLQRLLVRHDGRRRLLARLGAERAEAVDALLGQALDYETLETPSLAGFLGWFDSAEPELKRQPGQGALRVMSVHGAKGLEAPVVILPDCAQRKPPTVDGVQVLPCGTAVWMPVTADRAPAQQDLADARAAAERAEWDRLLYVAMTRAESWLIVAAAGDVGNAPADSWHGMVKAGLTRLGPTEIETPHGPVTRYQTGDWTGGTALRASPDADARAAPPDWLETPPPPVAASPPVLSPSQLPGAKVLPGEAEDMIERGAALRRGTAVHLLLEHLPGLAASARDDAARTLLSQADLWPEDDAAAILDEVRAVLDDPDLAWLFGPDSLAELPFALPPVGGRPAVSGTMDRVVASSERIVVVDYKTNLREPDDPREVPEGLLAQMGAYLAAAQAIWPDRTVDVAILWTRSRRLMTLPHDLVKAAFAAIDPPAGGA